ncbi:TPA: DUF1127 domain-containing protein [Escherichia coli]|nr:DUF1127 domain-containing protein [Escherichia coli]HEO9833761.1 DUF1127 domain-containing protein [Escherichia coli]
MKPLKDEEAADGISRKQSQNAVYQTCATLACGEALGRQMQTRRVLQQMSDERLRDIGLRREDVE